MPEAIFCCFSKAIMKLRDLFRNKELTNAIAEALLIKIKLKIIGRDN